MNISSLIIRRSPAILIYRIGWMTMVFYLFTTVAYAGVSYVLPSLEEVPSARLLRSLATITLESIVIVALFIHWSITTYEIRPNELVYRYGFFKRRMDIHSLKNMQTIYSSQGLLGRTFGYGTIRLYNPLSKEELLLENVPDPDRHAEFMRQALDVPSQETIVRRR